MRRRRAGGALEHAQEACRRRAGAQARRRPWTVTPGPRRDLRRRPTTTTALPGPLPTRRHAVRFPATVVHQSSVRLHLRYIAAASSDLF